MENDERKIKEVIELSPSELHEDPLNEEAFVLDDVSYLKESLEENGFFGEIVAYRNSEGQYVIESGHRRKRAAEEAGLSKVAVSIVDPPTDNLDRRKRLIRWNLHGRPATPIAMAKLAKFQFDTYEMENKYRASAGLSTFPINERVAKDLECSVSNVVKYKSLLKLIPQLQDLVENGTVPWTSILKACPMDEWHQTEIYKSIKRYIKINPEISNEWLEHEIWKISCIKNSGSNSSFDRNDTRFYSDELLDRLKDGNDSDKRFRRKDGVKGVSKALKLLSDSLTDGALIRQRDLPSVIDELKEIIRLSEEYLK